jgi:hypothetical protein
MFNRPIRTQHSATLALLCTVAILPPAALADGPGYSYVEAGYVETDVDGTNASLDGYALRGSFALTDKWFVFAGYTDQSYGGLDIKDYGAGVGYAWPVAATTDLYGKLSIVRAEADFEGFSLTDDGLAAAFGVRSRFNDRFELEASAGYTELSDSGGGATLGAAARWYFVKRFAVGIEAVAGEDTTAYGIDVRWEFGN